MANNGGLYFDDGCFVVEIYKVATNIKKMSITYYCNIRDMSFIFPTIVFASFL